MTLKVLHIVRTPLTVQAFLRPILAEHARRGHQVHLAYAPDANVDEDFGVPVHTYPMERSLSPLGLIKSITTLKQIIAAGKYDVVVPHMGLVGAVARLAYAQANIPGKMLYASHGLPCYPHNTPWKRLGTRLLEQWLSRWQAGMIVLNQHDYDIGRQFCHGHIHLLQTIGIDNNHIQARVQQSDKSAVRKALNLDHGRPLVCYAGRLTRAKGADQFMRIAQRALNLGADVTFAIAGFGPLEGELKQFIEQHQLQDRVIMLGWNSEMIELLAASDILCFPTLYEGAPVIVQEAMAVGTVVVTSDAPGPVDLVEHNQTGLIAPAGDIERFANLIISTLSDSDQRQRLVSQAKIQAQQYDVSQWAPRWVDVIEATASEINMAENSKTTVNGQ
jgi:glycosyltransferase involved in cell wall biosynthesis